MMSDFFGSLSPVFASSLFLDKPKNYYHTSISPDIGYAMCHNSHVLKLEGKTVFCIESDILAYSDASCTSKEHIKA